MLRSILAIVLSLSAALSAETITVLAAASTKDALAEVAQAFQKETGIEIRISPGASNTLAQQIIHGAPAEVFISASPEWVDAIDKEGLVAEQVALLENQLVIVTNQNSPPVTSPDDLKREDVKRVALAGEKVPAGKYAQQALTFHKVYDFLVTAGRIVRGDDVRATLAYVERGEADAGIVYSTDAKIAPDVTVSYTFDSASHDKIVYPAALLAGANANAAARQFYDHLSSPAAGEIFAKHGFVPLQKDK
jgi:molybdate transport system substrate-binding protein